MTMKTRYDVPVPVQYVGRKRRKREEVADGMTKSRSEKEKN